MINNKVSAGLPGYGTKGNDGNPGNTGLSTYFAGYNGLTEKSVITSKIINNKVLFPSENNIPGFPQRVYQSGETFIDINSNIFMINLDLDDKFEFMNMSLAKSSIFTTQVPQTDIPNFTRYSNTIVGTPGIIDSIYATTFGGSYTSYPSFIYNTSPLYYAKINYINVNALDTRSYYPFQLWSTGNNTNDDHIALSRERNANTWHFGNNDFNIQREVSLNLDFSKVIFMGDVSIAGYIYNTGKTVMKGDVSIGKYLTVEGSTNFKSTVTLEASVNIISPTKGLGIYAGKYGDTVNADSPFIRFTANEVYPQAGGGIKWTQMGGNNVGRMSFWCHDWVGDNVSWSEKMNINGTGNVNINYAGDAGYKLYVNGIASITGELSSNSIKTAGDLIIFYHNSWVYVAALLPITSTYILSIPLTTYGYFYTIIINTDFGSGTSNTYSITELKNTWSFIENPPLGGSLSGRRIRLTYANGSDYTSGAYIQILQTDFGGTTIYPRFSLIRMGSNN